MKKIVKNILFLAVCLDIILLPLASVFGFSSEACFNQAAHSETTEYSWYTMPRTDGLQPQLASEFSFIDKYNAYFINGPEEKVIYLTFDAGYENGNAGKMLDTLKAHNVKAAFFLVGHYIKTNPDIVKRMAEEGHLVCSHTMNHKNMAAMTDIKALKEELEKLETLYYETTGKQMAKYLRPPEGRFSELSLEFARQLGYSTVFWSFAYKDWLVDNQPSTDSAYKTIISRTHPGEIALLHLTSSTNAAVLDSVLTEWEKMGYKFGTLDDLTADSHGRDNE